MNFAPVEIKRKREEGQTLIIAMIVLGVLLLLGFVFLGIVDRNVHGGATAQTRLVSNDIAEAGIQYVQQELVTSPMGADWRGTPTILPQTVPGNNLTIDPDAYYLRPGNPGVAYSAAHPNQIDLGGPDGLGPFIRINFNNGRALVRVRYGPSDANIFNANPTGPLTNPGVVHNYLIIEAIGRQGQVNLNDPTTLRSGPGVQFQGFANTAQLNQAVQELAQFDGQIPNSRHLIAFATPAITDYARYITDKFHESRPAEIGFPNPVGVGFDGVDVSQIASTQLGSTQTIPGPANWTTPAPASGGSIFSNAILDLSGNLTINLNQTLGDKILCADMMEPDPNAQVTINQATFNPTTNNWTSTTSTLTAAQLTSSNGAYTSVNGAVLDGVMGLDAAGYPRGVGYLTPPSILALDPSTKENRYLELTRDSGVVLGSTNSGEFGHGQGVYVNNANDLQVPLDEAGRAGTGSSESLFDDWLNPGNGSKTSGWIGPFYIPVGAYVRLLPDGFTIQLDSGTWLNPNGASPASPTSTIRYRVGYVNGVEYIVDSLEDPNDINGTVPASDYTGMGQPFNGVLYFEGNVRIRGMIPTDVQLTLVSGATIYIEGSIVKGTIGNDVTAGETGALNAAYDATLTRPSRSTLMLMAKDNVCVNPTMFVGPPAGQALQAVNDLQLNTGFSPVDMSPSSTLDLHAELVNDPTTGTALNPSTYMPYALNYQDSLNPGALIPSKLLLTQTMADGNGEAALIAMNVNSGAYAGNQDPSVYYFPGTGSAIPNSFYFQDLDNTAADYLFNSGSIPSASTSVDLYGLGADAWQRYDKYESRGFNLVYPAASNYAPATGLITEPSGGPVGALIGYALNAPGGNDFLIRPGSLSGVPTNDYLLARTAIVPDDIRIECSVFAEEGSFFVIPGNWFSPDPNDTRVNYNAQVATLGVSGADEQRLESYGSSPDTPFYGEPLDMRIQIVGSVSENMPPPAAIQAQWLMKWGWIPVPRGADGYGIPTSHIPAGVAAGNTAVVPNLLISYDPELATGRVDGFSATNNPSDLVRTDSYMRPLPPMPRLPVSPVLAYFGEVQ